MLQHCVLDNLGKSHLDFWWKLKNDNYLQRYYWGNPWEVFPKRALELEIEKDLKSKDIRRVSQFVVKDILGEYAGYIMVRRNLWSEAPVPSYAFVSVIPVNDVKLSEPALDEAFNWLLEMCFINYRADVVCVEPLEDNSAYIAFLEKHGFSRQGLLRNCFMDKGVFLGRVMMDLLQEEWQAKMA